MRPEKFSLLSIAFLEGNQLCRLEKSFLNCVQKFRKLILLIFVDTTQFDSNEAFVCTIRCCCCASSENTIIGALVF